MTIMSTSTMLGGLTVFLSLLVYFATACTDTVYVGTGGGQVVKSSDGGQTWSTVYNADGIIYSVRVDGDHVYAATANGIAISHDNGTSWSVKNLQQRPACTSIVRSIFVDQAKRVYALYGYNRGCTGEIAVSSDQGETWPINFEVPDLSYGYKAENIYVDGSRIYVATSSGNPPPSDQGVGFGYTDNMGAQWTFMNQASGLGSNEVDYVIGRGQTIYVGLSKDGAAVSMSKDGGGSWTTTNTTPTGLNDYVWTMYLQDDRLYVATQCGGLSWSDDFTNWTTKTTVDGLADNCTTTIVVSGNNLYLGTYRNGLSISRDKGRTWITKTIADGLPGTWIESVSVQCI